MRIVAGDFRGRTITAPEGPSTRPTTDRVREALFSSLYSLRGGFDGAVVLDAFAGSGALGLEAISRGAESAVLYESDEKAAAICKRNRESCKVSADKAQIVARDVLRNPPTAVATPFDLVFLDPPYAYDAGEVLALPVAMRETGALAKDAIIVYEHARGDDARVASAAEEAGFNVVSYKKYGKTGITVLRA